MMKDEMNTPLDMAVAHAYCRQFGLAVGGAWSVSFLMAMWGMSNPLMGNLGTVLGLLSVMMAGRLLRGFRLSVHPITYRQAWWMALVTYGCATLVTAMVQYLHFRFLDHGHMFNVMMTLMEQPDYRQLLVQAAGGMSAKEIEKMMADMMLSPTNMTLTLLWYNVILSLVLSIPTALLAMRGKKKPVE